ncbi:hypothetical protein [Streptomyces sp. DW26H14]|uniref:hypothetical protein n=1 Tax=Streptomyces sp. DW26H14 TaxID=3435395 RepID=UPI00403D8F06
MSITYDTSKVIPGEVVDRHNEAAEPRTPVARRAGSAAMVAARVTGRGLAGAGRRWVDGYVDGHRQMIETAKAELAAAKGDSGAEADARRMLTQRRAEYREHRKRYLAKTGIGVGGAGLGATVGTLVIGGWVDAAMAIVGITAGAIHGRKGGDDAVAAPVILPDGTVVAPVPGGETLLDALAAIRVPDGSQIVSVTPGPGGTSETVVNLPANFTVTSLRGKAEELAGALGRDTTMIDIRKVAHANQAAVWISSTDPFEAPRRSPLMDLQLAIDAFLDGVPVAWGKRGNPILLPINNSNFLIAGMTRSGKGVGAANLVAGAALDPRINLRIVAGKNNGEWDPAAKAGVAATYFKPNPRRLNELLKALWADKDRRERILGKASKSKVTAATIMELGGIELLVIDEVATYTRPGNDLRDENLKLLTDLSAVAAAAGILIVLITQYPEVDVIPQALAMNCGTRWAMRVDNATQSNAILGGSASSSGRDASKFDPPRPGLGWLVNPFAGVTDLARSFDLDEDERGEVSELMMRGAKIREQSARLAGQWDDPIEQALINATGLSSRSGGPDRNGVPGRAIALAAEEKAAYAALADAVAVMDRLGRDAQLKEMADEIGNGMTETRLGELLRSAGAGKTVKVDIFGRGRVQGYRRDDLADLLDRAEAA